MTLKIYPVVLELARKGFAVASQGSLSVLRLAIS